MNRRSLRLHSRRLALRAIDRAARTFDRRLVPVGMFGPVPDLPRPDDPPSAWNLSSRMRGVKWDLDGQLAFVESDLAGYVKEFTPPEHGTGREDEFYLANLWYAHGDAELLYAIVRWAKPQRIIEIGSGFSTLVSAAACSANASAGRPCRLISIDPSPRVALPLHLPELEIVHARVQELDLEWFSGLRGGDIVFVDGTHTVKRGSDAVHLVLEVLPLLPPGVLVHLHDIFLPFDYPRQWYENGIYWAEQWLVQSYLAHNPRYQTILAAYALCQHAPEGMTRLITSIARATVGPSALWIRSTASAS